MDTITWLTQRDTTWRKFALKICGCPTLADDIVQDTYLKLYNYKKQLSNSYVYFAIRSVYIDYLRKQIPCLSIDDIEINLTTEQQEVTDVENEINNKLSLYDEYYAELALINADGKSLRKIAKEYRIHYLKVYYEIKAIKEDMRKDIKLKSLYLSINP